MTSEQNKVILDSMNTQYLLITPTSRAHRPSPKHLATRLRRGFTLTSSPNPTDTPWECRRTAYMARIQAIHLAMRQQIIFILHSALFLWGIDGWLNNPDVTFRSSSRYHPTTLNRVDIGANFVPAVQAKAVHIPLDPQPFSFRGLLVDSLENTALAFASSTHPLEAFVAVCGIMRRLTDFDRFALAHSRHREKEVREKLLSLLKESAIYRGVRQARNILQWADASCESVGERALLWAILTVSPIAPVCQYEVQVEGRIFYLDFAFPDLRLAFEFDGMSKMGSNESEFRQAQREMLDRQRLLERQGWRVLRFQWQDFRDFDRLREIIISHITQNRRQEKPVATEMWKPLPQEINCASRRFM